MDIKPEDFPLYGVLVQFNQAGSVDHVINDMQKAQTGGPDDKYSFALGLWQIASNADIQKFLPGATTEVCQRTIEKCTEVFASAAESGSVGAKAMLDYIRGSSAPAP